MIKKKTKAKRLQVCNNCGTKSESTQTACAKCGSERFAPPWVLEKRPISRLVSVEITETNPSFGKTAQRITLSKWWPAGRSTFHIKDAPQWQGICQGVNELAGLLNWPAYPGVTMGQSASLENGAQIDINTINLFQKQPELLARLISALDVRKLGERALEDLVQALTELARALTAGNARFREAAVAVLEKLPKQSPKALEDFEALLRSWNLSQVTSVAQTIRARLETIELLKQQIRDERVFEIRGDNSIHRILEKSMWMIDERYWLLHSNATLRTVIGDGMAQKDKKRFGKKRPDFVCGSVGQKLIIVELKRPLHTLSIEDINQLETYLTLVEEYTGEYRSFEAYLVGSKQDSDLLRRLKLRSNIFRVLTYADLIDKCEARYAEFLKEIAS